MTCDKLLERVGELGLFQVYYLLFMGFTKILCGIHILLPVFNAHQRPYWCAIWPNTTEFKCSHPNSTIFSDRNVSCPRNQWAFDTSIIASTIQSQYSLVCNREMLVPLVTSFFMGGFLVGGSLYGFLSDRFGRSKMSSVVSLHALFVSLCTTYAPTFELYVLARFLMGVAIGGVLTISNTCSVEIMTAKWRLLGMTTASLGWIVGYYVIICVAYLDRLHTNLQNYMSLAALPGIFCYFVVPEPVRWLIINDYIEKAYKVAKKIAYINKRPCLSREEFEQYLAKIPQLRTDGEGCSNWEKFKSQFRFLRYKNLRRITFIMWFLFASTSFIAYSLTFSIGRFDENVYRNVLIMSIIAPIQYLPVYALGHCLGRVKLLIISYGIATMFIFSLIGFYKVKNYSEYAIWLALIGKFFILLAFLIIWLLGTELYPTQFRTSAVGSCSTFARLGALLSPQVMYLDLFWRPLPFIIYGFVAFLACLVSFLLPETRGIPTMETVVQGESFAKHNRLWKKRFLPINENSLDEEIYLNNRETDSGKPG